MNTRRDFDDSAVAIAILYTSRFVGLPFNVPLFDEH